MKILGYDVPIETRVTMPDNKIVLVAHPRLNDVPVIDAKDFQITSEHKDGNMVVTISCKAVVDQAELEKRIAEGRIVVLEAYRSLDSYKESGGKK